MYMFDNFIFDKYSLCLFYTQCVRVCCHSTSYFQLLLLRYLYHYVSSYRYFPYYRKNFLIGIKFRVFKDYFVTFNYTSGVYRARKA